jgi:chitodextrinase
MRRTFLVLMLAAVLAMFIGSSPAGATINQFSVDRNATLAPGGTAVTLTGTITCAPGDTFFVVGQVFQQKNSAQGQNTNTTSPSCSGSSQTWQLTAQVQVGQSGPFHPGKASASTTASTCCATQTNKTVGTVVQLH